MIVYLHGLSSAGTSSKAAWLRAQLPEIEVLSPTYPVHVTDAAPTFLRVYLARVRRERPQEKKLLLVGSSLGGFWARFLAREEGAGMVLINPAMHPEAELLSAIGRNRNFATGEEYTLTREHVQALARYQVPRCDSEVPTLVLLDEGDELLDYRAAQAFYRDCAEIIVYPGGSHRFEHLPDALPEIRCFYARL